MQDFDVLARKAASQHGLLTRQQLRDEGISRARLDRLVADGLLTTESRSVVGVAGAPHSWERSLMAAVLRAGALTVGSHRSAIRLWGLRSADDELEIALPSHRGVRISGVVVHRSVDLQAEDRTVLDGVPVTTPERTLVDAGLIFPEREVRRLVGQALITRITTRDRLWSIRRRVGVQGRTGVVALERALESLPGEQGAESDPELEMRALIRRAGMEEPVAQFGVDAGARHYRLDLSYPTRRVALEYDGFDPHISIEAFERDRERQNLLVIAGWVVLRYTWSDLRRHPERMVGQIRRALG